MRIILLIMFTCIAVHGYELNTLTGTYIYDKELTRKSLELYIVTNNDPIDINRFLDNDNTSQYELNGISIIYKDAFRTTTYQFKDFVKTEDGIFQYRSGSNYLDILPKNHKILVAMGQMWIVYKLKE